MKSDAVLWRNFQKLFTIIFQNFFLRGKPHLTVFRGLFLALRTLDVLWRPYGMPGNQAQVGYVQRKHPSHCTISLGPCTIFKSKTHLLTQDRIFGIGAIPDDTQWYISQCYSGSSLTHGDLGKYRMLEIKPQSVTYKASALLTVLSLQTFHETILLTNSNLIFLL